MKVVATMDRPAEHADALPFALLPWECRGNAGYILFQIVYNWHSLGIDPVAEQGAGQQNDVTGSLWIV